jgi:hypothetical protein
VYRIFDNAIPNPTIDLIENTLTSVDFPWFINPKSVSNVRDLNANGMYKDRCSFAHSFIYGNRIEEFSGYYPIAKILLDNIVNVLGINECLLTRAQANYTYPIDISETYIPFPPHVDRRDTHIVILYYAIDSDGPTLLFNNNSIIAEIKPVKGRFLVFKGHILHAGNSPKYHDKRIVINYNLITNYKFNN